MQKYREFLPGAPEELGAFVGLKTVLPVDPFPAEHRGKLACGVIACFNGPADEGEKVMGRLLDELPEPMFNWLGEMPFPAMQSLFDPFYPQGAAVVLARRLREGADGRSDRRASRSSRQIPEPAFDDASLPDRWRRTARWQAPTRHGTRATRPGAWSSAGVDADPQKAGELTRWTKGILGGHPSLLEGRRRLRELHDGRWRRTPAEGHLWRQLRPPRRPEREVRPGELLQRQPEHQAKRRCAIEPVGPQDLLLIIRPRAETYGRKTSCW